MPRFYCDYCDIYLTHDSTRVRKDHNNGWKHRMHIQNYYTELDGVKVQQIINSITKAYVYAGLGGFPELPGHQSNTSQPIQQKQPQPAPVAFNPAILASLPPPPGFRMPTNASGMPVFPPPPPGMMFPMPGMPPMPSMPTNSMPPPAFFPPPPPPPQ